MPACIYNRRSLTDKDADKVGLKVSSNLQQGLLDTRRDKSKRAGRQIIPRLDSWKIANLDAMEVSVVLHRRTTLGVETYKGVRHTWNERSSLHLRTYLKKKTLCFLFSPNPNWHHAFRYTSRVSIRTSGN